MANQVTPEQVRAALRFVAAIAGSIQDAGECPSGPLYAAVMGRISLEAYQKILDTLARQGLITVSPCHMIRWIGPAKAVPNG